jgi:hypothetical protein
MLQPTTVGLRDIRIPSMKSHVRGYTGAVHTVGSQRAADEV